MANSCLNQPNLLEKYGPKSYPASVTEFSAMLLEARTETSPVRAPPPTTLERRLTKKSHTCGSLYAKCRCNNDSGPETETKRSSTPDTWTIAKRLSSPEIDVHQTKHPNVCLKPKSATKTVKANVYLNHPEITFPIPVEIPKEQLPKQTKSLPSSVERPEIRKSQIDYHKFNVLAYESQPHFKEERAQKFLQDFGIFGPMGNGVASLRRSSRTSDDDLNQIRKNSKNVIEVKRKSSSGDSEYLKSMVAKLKKELAELEKKYGSVQGELFEARKDLSCRETEVLKLQREVHKLKSVLQQTAQFKYDQDILSSIQAQHAMANRNPQSQTSGSSHLAKKQGVSAESSESTGLASDINIVKYEKDFRSKQLIKDAILDNDFLRNLDTVRVREMVDSMYSMEVQANTVFIREGDSGAHLYVSAEGEFEVIKQGAILGRIGPGKTFGELALLYNCMRTASIRALEDSKVWVLDRRIFQRIMVRTGLQRLQDNIGFLRSVPLLAKLSNEVLAKIADVLEVEFYPAGAHIIRQGASGDTFFIISSGCVKVTQRLPGKLLNYYYKLQCSLFGFVLGQLEEEEEEIRTLQRGDYFGEQALLKEDCRTASIIAQHPGVECLTLDRDSFNQLIGDLSEIREKSYDDDERLNRPSSSLQLEKQEYDYIQLDDLEVISTLGIGGFGRVELVQYREDRSLTFALKCLKKQHIVDTQQQDHIRSEKTIMMGCRNPFICRLYRSFKDAKYVYMMLEACLGGEVWTILRDRGCFDDHTTRFIAGCVIEAFDYLHNRGLIYRDLKPENLLLDVRGYVKLVDFGFAKRLGYSSKTWTFCGTPEYVAPETILNKGHDRAVDYWALGILMHELLTGSPPFSASDPMKTYNLILKGIDMIDFAKFNVSRSAQSLIKKLCRDAPSERLGYQRGGVQDIKKHKWYQGFDWDGLISRTLPAPIQQVVRGPCDVTNFDCFGKDNDIPPDELSGWDKDF
ncbi:cGMP-dependent protein kinase, isozyme 1-like isoform X2 [Aethina tumida]|nr:cGMP-dependent protein kinase, isozyme 1-like isoform X2 [Aethina tumida]XP_049819330.1 cGMP-dependent protein kinase, isozyme 1-like isoform X2 [Aethina tumida]